jgi:hypothetical protein
MIEGQYHLSPYRLYIHAGAARENWPLASATRLGFRYPVAVILAQDHLGHLSLLRRRSHFCRPNSAQ